MAVEVADALRKIGKTPMIVVRSRFLRKQVEPEISNLVYEHLTKNGVRVIAGSPESIGGNSKAEYVLVKDKKISVDSIVIATGVVPNVELAQKAGVTIGKTYAIKIDEYARTSVKDIYAAGDCAEVLDLTTGRWIYFPLSSSAAYVAKYAAYNAVLKDKTKMKGFLRSQVTEIFGKYLVTIGISSEEAKKIKFPVKVINLNEEKVIPKEFYVDALLIVDKNERVVGAQIFGDIKALHYSYSLYNIVKGKQSLSVAMKRIRPIILIKMKSLLKQRENQ